MKKVIQGILFAVIGCLILYLVYQNQQAAYLEQCAIDGISTEDCSLIDKVWSDFKSVHISWILVVVFVFFLSNVARALRWNMLLKSMNYSVSKSNSFFSIMLGYFANLGFPRIGEVVRAGTLSRYEKIPVEKVMGTVVSDRVVDMLSLGVVILAAIGLEYDLIMGEISKLINTTGTEGAERSPLYWYVPGIAIFFGIALFLFRKQIKQLGIYAKIREMVKGFWQGILSIKSLDNPLLFIGYSISIWLCYYLMTYLCFFAFDPVADLSPTVGLVVFVFGSLGIVIPSPGGMGTYHFLVIYALSIYGISAGDGFSFANILFFSIQIFVNIFFGIVSLIVLPLINQPKKA